MSYRECGNRQARQVDGEDTPAARQVARVDPAVVGFSAPSAEGETQTHPGSVGAALLERSKDLVDIATRQSAALVRDFDQDALGGCANAERDGRLRPSELESVLQKISHNRGEYLPVRLNLHTGVARRDGDLTPRAFASKDDDDAISSMNPATANGSRF